MTSRITRATKKPLKIRKGGGKTSIKKTSNKGSRKGGWGRNNEEESSMGSRKSSPKKGGCGAKEDDDESAEGSRTLIGTTGGILAGGLLGGAGGALAGGIIGGGLGLLSEPRYYDAYGNRIGSSIGGRNKSPSRSSPRSSPRKVTSAKGSRHGKGTKKTVKPMKTSTKGSIRSGGYDTFTAELYPYVIPGTREWTLWTKYINEYVEAYGSYPNEDTYNLWLDYGMPPFSKKGFLQRETGNYVSYKLPHGISEKEAARQRKALVERVKMSDAKAERTLQSMGMGEPSDEKLDAMDAMSVMPSMPVQNTSLTGVMSDMMGEMPAMGGTRSGGAAIDLAYRYDPLYRQYYGNPYWNQWILYANGFYGTYGYYPPLSYWSPWYGAGRGGFNRLGFGGRGWGTYGVPRRVASPRRAVSPSRGTTSPRRAISPSRPSSPGRGAGGSKSGGRR